MINRYENKLKSHPKCSEEEEFDSQQFAAKLVDNAIKEFQKETQKVFSKKT